MVSPPHFDHEKLLMRFDPEQYRVHESAAGLATPFEHEHDDEHDASAETLAKED
jgi:hypothetical protein